MHWQVPLMPGWTIIAHVIPEGDLVGHVTLPDCICGPNAEDVEGADPCGGIIYTHHALDGREALERSASLAMTGGAT